VRIGLSATDAGVASVTGDATRAQSQRKSASRPDAPTPNRVFPPVSSYTIQIKTLKCKVDFKNNTLFCNVPPMRRALAAVLDTWLAQHARQPLVLRGARQVGKTWLVRDLGCRSQRDLVELNFERDPGLRRHFSSNDPKQITAELSLALNRDITAPKSLLFLDEIQAAPEVIGKLRWFAEELPELPVVAAGSLLEFALADPTFSVPVGRIGYRQVGPMGFSEYLAAHGENRLLEHLAAFRPGETLSPAAHQRALGWFHRYAMVGGMPRVVAEDATSDDPRSCRQLQRELIATYRDDFSRYSGRLDRDILDRVLLAVARSIGHKFVYARVDQGVKQHQAKRALELLAAARLCDVVRHSAAHGLPLGGEVKDNFRKVILVDVGLLHALLGTPAAGAFPRWDSLSPAVRGQIADQLTGQQLRLLGEGVGSGRELYYWQREGGRPGEIDYLLQVEGRIIPVELKSGTAGAMKSLHQFMFDRRLAVAVRVDQNPPSWLSVSVKTTQGDPVEYRLLSLPFYLVWRLPELLTSLAR
jgi:hypothetical protein